MRPIYLIPAAFLFCACAHAPKPGGQSFNSVHQSQSARQMQSYASVRSSSPQTKRSASLWDASPESLFGDRRARGVGDILTVMVDVDDEAQLSSSSSSDRQTDESFSIGSLFGLGKLAEGYLPDGADLNPGLDIEREASTSGQGARRRGGQVQLTLAAQVVGLTPSGDLIIEGQQDIQVDGDVRQIAVSGYVRREDISRRNTITLDKIARARVQYGGRGILARATADRIGTRVVSKIIPF